MSVIAVTGKIGGGKTYWCVNYLLKKHYNWMDEILDYVPKDDLVVITNIKDFALKHINLDEAIAEKCLEGVFCHDFVKSFKRQVVFIVDECQSPDKFHRKYYNPNVFLFFQTCRHSGVDIILVTQDLESVVKEVRVLCEYEVEAGSRTNRLGNTMRYQYKTGDGTFKRQSITFDTSVARCYKSFDAKELSAPKGVILKFIVIGVGCIGVFVGGIWMMGAYWKHSIGGKKAPVAQVAQRTPEAGVVQPSGTSALKSSPSEVLADVKPDRKPKEAAPIPPEPEPVKQAQAASDVSYAEARKRLVLLRERKPKGNDGVIEVGCVDNVCSVRE